MNYSYYYRVELGVISMVKKIELVFELGGRGVVELDEKNSPSYCKALWEHLPIVGTVRFAFHDKEVWIRHSLGIYKPEGSLELRKKEVWDKILAFAPERQGLAFMFGSCVLSKWTDYTPMGKIVEGADEMDKAWKRLIHRASVEKAYEIGTIRKLE